MGKTHHFKSDIGTAASPNKKRHHHKKHKKHKKKKTHHHTYNEQEIIDVVSDAIPVPVSEKKFKISSKIIPSESTFVPPITVSACNSSKTQKKKKGKGGKDSGTSSDEERWLDAIESGKLEEVDDELKKIKDPKLMTARQRAMYERTVGDKEYGNNTSEFLMSLPTYKEKVLTAEAIKKIQLKNQRRRQLADEKRENDKKKTMERLLKKQDSTKLNKQPKVKIIKASAPMISYRNTYEGSTITYPLSFDFPLKPQIKKDPPLAVLCGAPGCKNVKVYNCSKTNIPLCSFACFRKHVDSITSIIC